jgi:hypothetical protein
MLKKLLGRHRTVQIGVTLLGASALALGFASPAFAAQSVNNGNADNANAQNYLVVQGGSQAAYDAMVAESDLFNSAPGCDLVGITGTTAATAQPLDTGCPGLGTESGTTEAGTAQPAASVATYTVDVSAAGLKNLTLQSGSVPFTDLAPGDLVTDSGGVVPIGDPLIKAKSNGVIKLQFKTTGADTTDTFTVDYSPQQGQNGYAQWGAQNPFNDVVVQEQSYGASNGVAELEGTGSATNVGLSQSIINPDNNAGAAVNVSPIDSARSSSAPSVTKSYASGGNYAGLNYVAYAEDAVSYLSWNEFDGAKTESSKCLSAIQASGGVTTTDLKDIWNETYTGNTPSLTWSDLDPSSTACTSAPVYAYWSNSGAGTEKTWASATGATYPNGTFPSKNIIFQDETSAILSNQANTPIGDVIYFFSYGDYLHKCTPSVTTPGDTGYLQSNNPNCAGTSTTSTPNTLQLGATWVGATSNVTLDSTTVNAQLPGEESAEFPGDRLLYNVYSDGSNPEIPVSNDATLNFASEDGFLCKPGTATEVDPNTGLTFRSEIDSNLVNNGFLPLPALQVEDGQGDTSGGYNTTKSGIPHPAYNELHNSAYDSAKETSAPYNFPAADVDTDSTAWSGTYQADDGSATPSTQVASGTAPIGYCITMTTDGDTAGNG